MALDNIQDKVPINGTLVTMGIHGKVALAEQIYDDDIKDLQSNINKQLKEDIKNAKPQLKTINGESLLGEGNINVVTDIDLSEQIEHLSDEIASNTGDISTIKSENTTRDLQISDHEDRIITLEEKSNEGNESISMQEVETKISESINALNSELSDGSQVVVNITQEQGKISTIIVDESKLTSKITELQTGVDTANQMIDNLDTKMEEYIPIEGDSVKNGNFDIRGTLSLGTEAETYASIDDDGNADFTSLKIAGREVLPVVIPFSALTSDNGVTIWNKLQFALKNSVPLFISYLINESSSVKQYALFPINADYVGGGRYVISYTTPNYNSTSNNIISHTTHTIGIGDTGYLDNAWASRTSLCAVPITQAEYDALTTKEDVLYVIKG